MRLSAVLSLGVLTALIAAAPAGAAPTPQLGRSFVVAPAGGAVRVQAAGSGRFVALKRARTVRVGSVVDATRGRVRLSAARSYSGVFRGGAFRATQARRAGAVVELRLVGDCRRRLWAEAEGRFRTRGRYAAATVTRSSWLTRDGCDSTRLAVARGAVTVTSPGTSYELEQGSVYDTRATGRAGRFVSTAVVYDLPRSRSRRGKHGPDGSVVFLLTVDRSKASARSADVCVQRSGGVEERCTTYGFTEIESGRYGAYDGCDPESGPGDYTVRWRVEGLDVPLPLVAHAPTPDPYWREVYQQPGSWCVRHKQVSAIP